MPQLPSAVRTIRAPKSSLERASAALGPVVAKPVPASPAPEKPAPEEPRELNVIGPRKLIRPTLPGGMQARRYPRREEPILQWHSGAQPIPATQGVSHAETFYFQKQLQSQTPMVFVLEDGERIEGVIEWYDRNAIKVRCTAIRSSGPRVSDTPTRALIYKSCIKYLYKAGENQPQF